MSEWSTEWSNELILFFLELYQGEPVIWDPKHKHHKDKKKVADAWARLETALNTPVKELKAKKEVLMGTFRRHLKKKQESMRSSDDGADDIYEPAWFAYPLMESFLLPVVYATRETIKTEMVPKQKTILSNGVGNGLKLRKDRAQYESRMLRHSRFLKDEEHMRRMEMAEEEHKIKMEIHKEKLNAAILEREILELRKEREAMQ